MSVHSNSVTGIYKFEQLSQAPNLVSSIGARQEGWVFNDYTCNINISIPRWLSKLLGYGDEGVTRYIVLKLSLRPDWNCLVSLPWRVVRSRSAPSLVPDNVFVKFIK